MKNIVPTQQYSSSNSLSGSGVSTVRSDPKNKFLTKHNIIKTYSNILEKIIQSGEQRLSIYTYFNHFRLP